VVVESKGSEALVDKVISQELFTEQLEEVRSSELPSIYGWDLLGGNYPELQVRMSHPGREGRDFLLEFSRFDDYPPSIKLIYENGVPLLDAKMLPQGGPHFFRYNAPTNPYPSMCYDFTSEYYDWWHAGSISVWQSKRNTAEFRMLGILNQLYQLYRQTNG
jgi:hypothetical protein